MRWLRDWHEEVVGGIGMRKWLGAIGMRRWWVLEGDRKMYLWHSMNACVTRQLLVFLPDLHLTMVHDPCYTRLVC